jgi:peptidoglycan biosynthesis protein MviN/MurJ (putative lipid II flippase)
VLFDLSLVALILAVSNVAFRRFDPDKPLWRRLLKSVFTLAISAAISQYFGRTGVLIAIGIALLLLIYVHAIWLPRHGINGWTAEPRDKYYALRGWSPPNP